MLKWDDDLRSKLKQLSVVATQWASLSSRRRTCACLWTCPTPPQCSRSASSRESYTEHRRYILSTWEPRSDTMKRTSLRQTRTCRRKFLQEKRRRCPQCTDMATGRAPRGRDLTTIMAWCTKSRRSSRGKFCSGMQSSWSWRQAKFLEAIVCAAAGSLQAWTDFSRTSRLQSNRTSSPSKKPSSRKSNPRPLNRQGRYRRRHRVQHGAVNENKVLNMNGLAVKWILTWVTT